MDDGSTMDWIKVVVGCSPHQAVCFAPRRGPDLVDPCQCAVNPRCAIFGYRAREQLWMQDLGDDFQTLHQARPGATGVGASVYSKNLVMPHCRQVVPARF